MIKILFSLLIIVTFNFEKSIIYKKYNCVENVQILFQKKSDKVNDHLLNGYLLISESLIESNLDRVKINAQSLIDLIKKNQLDIKLKNWKNVKDDLVLNLNYMIKMNDIEHQRKYFSKLTEEFYQIVKKNDFDKNLYYQYCPMANSFWLSDNEKIKNPYYGSKMLSCGTTKEVLK